jgi:hypothetical protein
MRNALLVVPGAPRALAAASVVIAIAAPLLDGQFSLALLAWHAVALACIGMAWLLVLVDRAATRDVDDAFTAIQLAAAGAER